MPESIAPHAVIEMMQPLRAARSKGRDNADFFEHLRPACDDNFWAFPLINMQKQSGEPKRNERISIGFKKKSSFSNLCFEVKKTLTPQNSLLFTALIRRKHGECAPKLDDFQIRLFFRSALRKKPLLTDVVYLDRSLSQQQSLLRCKRPNNKGDEDKKKRKKTFLPFNKTPTMRDVVIDQASSLHKSIRNLCSHKEHPSLF